MQAKYSDTGLVIIGVNLDNDLQEAQEFLEEFPADFRIYNDTDKDLAKEYGVQAMPTTFILDRDGQVLEKHYGFKVKKQEEYEAAIVDALRGGGHGDAQ